MHISAERKFWDINDYKIKLTEDYFMFAYALGWR